MDKKRKREVVPDILRGFAIFMVVLGHCIQEGSGLDFSTNAMCFQDKWYQFIYSFHMPLFMLLSGYFAWDSMERAKTRSEQWKLLRKRSADLLIPIFAWTCFDCGKLLLTQEPGNPVFQTSYVFVKYFVNSLMTSAWFLWAVFWCFSIVFFVHYYFRDSKVLYLIGFVLMFFIPDGLGLSAYKYMLPYFVTAFYYRGWLKNPVDKEKKTYCCTEKMAKLSSWIWCVGVGALFFGLFTQFDVNSFIYFSGYKLVGKPVLKQLGIDFYRMLIGFVGAGFFILLWKNIVKMVPRYSFPVMSALGKNSLGIYMISGYIILHMGISFGEYFQPDYLLNLLQAIAVTLISFCLNSILKRIPLIKRMVGNR